VQDYVALFVPMHVLFLRGMPISATSKLFLQIILPTRVARWYILKPKIPLWVNFGGPWNGKRLVHIHILGHLEYITAIWYILCSFGIFYVHLVIKWRSGTFSSVLVYCGKKNLATLLPICKPFKDWLDCG
jgi:hypothetical protein